MKKVSLGLLLFLVLHSTVWAQSGTQWALQNIDEKLTSESLPIENTVEMQHAARGEYVPFQMLFVSDDDVIDAPTLEYDRDLFYVALYEQVFLPVEPIPYQPIFSTAWLTAPYIADGLQPMGESLQYGVDGRFGVWVDVLVKPNVPAGVYTIGVSWGGETQSFNVTVHDVMMPSGGGMSIVVPLSYGWTVPHYARTQGMDVMDYHQGVNEVLSAHGLIAGSFAVAPQFDTETRTWDFSVLDTVFSSMPQDVYFHAPMPYSELLEAYLFTDMDGETYTEADWDDPVFVDTLTAYFEGLAAYLAEQNRLEGALAYPIDETFWVADEPDNNGGEGYVRLEIWSEMIRAAGIRVTGSRVLPVPYAPNWPNGADMVDDSHVHADYIDAAPNLFALWNAEDNKSFSAYLNQYGDMIDQPASVNRGLAWHIYGRGSRMLGGYAALEWLDEDFRLIDPIPEPERLYSHFGYGVGALVYPDLTASVRLKLLRESVEDTRLLDLYAQQTDAATAQRLAHGASTWPMSSPVFAADTWRLYHEALLVALSGGGAINLTPFAPMNGTESMTVLDPETQPMGDWEFDNVYFEVVANPVGEGQAMQMTFQHGENSAFYWFGAQDWSGYDVLVLDILNSSPSFAEFDVAIGDDSGNYLLLLNNSSLVPPNEWVSLQLPLVVPYGVDKDFDWTQVTYIEMAVNTEIERTNGAGERVTYEIAERTLTIDNIRLGR